MRANSSVVGRRGSSAVWLVAAALAALALFVVLNGREPSNVGSLSSPTLLPVPGVQNAETLQDLLRAPGEAGAVGDPRLGAAPSGEAAPAEPER